MARPKTETPAKAPAPSRSARTAAPAEQQPVERQRAAPRRAEQGGISTLASLIDRLAEYGDHPAVMMMRPARKGVDEWSYEQLADHARRLARGLIDRGIETGQSIVLIAGNRPEWIAACLGIVRAGAVPTPLDTQLGDEAIKRIVKDAEPGLIFTDRAQFQRLEQIDLGRDIEFHLLNAEESDERSWRRLLADSDGAADDLPEAGPDDQAALFYTSGTTGPSKGVPLTHANLAFQIDALRKADLVTAEDRMLLPLPLHHVYPYVMGMLVPLALGLAIVLPKSRTGPEIVRALRESEATAIIGVPRLYRAMEEGVKTKAQNAGALAWTVFRITSAISRFARRRLGIRNAGRFFMRPLHRKFGPKLRLLASGGSPLDPELAWRLESLGWRIAIGYGLTETAPLLSLMKPGEDRFDTVGKPIEGVEIRIDPAGKPGEDSDISTGQVVNKSRGGESESEGEVLARGPNVFAGYRNLSEKTDEAFADGWFRTGDLGYLDTSGYLHLTGRASTLIVTEGGKNVQPDEVEDAYAADPRIREAGVLQRENRLVALIVPETSEPRGEADSSAAIKEAVRERSQRLPSYQRISDFLITRKSLPRTRLGKLRRHLLEEQFEEVQRKGDAAAAGATPRTEPTPVEEMADEDQALLRHAAAKQVWDWLGDQYPDRGLTPDSNPQLDLGIDSMQWLNLTLDLSERSGVELDEEAIAEAESVRDLLQRVIEASEEAGAERTQPLEKPDEVLDDDQKRWLEPLNPAMGALSRGLFGFNRLLMRTYFRIDVRGIGNLPRDRHFILTPNHISHLDPIILGAVLKQDLLRNMTWAAWAGIVFHNPVNRLVCRLAGAVPIDPPRAAVSSLAVGAAALKRGRNLVWFPEAQRSEDGNLQPFRAGIGMLLNHFKDVPAVPVHFSGTFEALPKGGLLPRPRRVRITIGEPIDAGHLESEGEGDSPEERIANALREHVRRLGEHGRR